MVIVAGFPFEFYFLRDKVIANLVIDVCLVSLTELVASWDTKHPPVLNEMRACLVKTKRNISWNTLLPDIKYPIVIAWSCINPWLSANRYFFDRLIRIRGKIYGGKDWRNNDTLMLYRERQKNWQTIISHFLAFHCTSHDDIVITFAPVVGYALHKTVDAFGEEKEP